MKILVSVVIVGVIWLAMSLIVQAQFGDLLELPDEPTPFYCANATQCAKKFGLLPDDVWSCVIPVRGFPYANALGTCVPISNLPEIPE